MAERETVVEQNTAAPEEVDALERIGSAQVVIGLPSCDTADSLTAALQQVRSAVRSRLVTGNTVLLHSDALEPPADNDAGDPSAKSPILCAPLPFPAAPESRFATLEPVLSASQKLSAGPCCVWTSPPEQISAAAIGDLLQPILESSFDLAVARYSGLRYDALINTGIVYPLTRSLYGLRVRYPMATDLAFSPALTERLLRPDAKTGKPAARNWIPAFAACEKFRVCQVDIGSRLPPAPATEPRTALVNVLTPLMAEIEKTATHWQRFRGSQELRTYGKRSLSAETTGPIDVAKMIEAFHLGSRNLRDVWSPLLPPATLLQVKKLAAMPAEQFHFADDVWARCVYDFTLGYRLRLMSADHLIGALTPLYLAWVSSYALQVRNYTAAQVEDRIEQLCVAFEAQKPYFLSRWRWPDRFNP